MGKNTQRGNGRKDSDKEKISPRGKIPISLQFSVLLGRFACIFIQHVSLTSRAGGRLWKEWREQEVGEEEML